MKAKHIVDHLSYSAIRAYLTSPAKFWNQYILREPFKPNLAMAAGSAWHKGVEEYLLGNDEYIPAGWEKMMEFKAEQAKTLEDEEFQEFCKKFSKEYKDLLRSLEDYPSFKRAWSPGKFIEVKVSMPSPVEGGLPITGVVDVIDINGNPVDHKYVSRFSTDKEKYYVQAWFYYYIAHNLTGKYPHHMIISEFKKTKNRDESPQLREMVINYEKKWMKKIDEWYVMVSRQILAQKEFVANPFQMYGGDDWKSYLNN